MPSTETCHFWLGYFSSRDLLEEYFSEDYDSSYGDDDDDRDDGYEEESDEEEDDDDEDDEGDDERPISQFARDQGETYYDHDFMELGFKEDAESVKDLVHGYSYHEQYEDELTELAADLPIKSVNTFLFITDSEIRNPQTVEGDGYSLYYVGTITYKT